MKKMGGSPKSARPIPMGNKKGKLESKHDTKIGPEKQGKKTMPGPDGGKGNSKPPARQYPPGPVARVSKHGFLINAPTYQ